VAVESYVDIPPAARAELIARIRGQREDGLVLIGRDTLVSPQGTATRLRDMHWRGGLCRGEVLRGGWAPQHVEKALLYCAMGHCVVVPVVCGNVARVDFAPRERAQQPVVPHRPIHKVPEPSSLALVAAALAVLAVPRRKT
jgi:hypothetical protein